MMKLNLRHFMIIISLILLKFDMIVHCHCIHDRLLPVKGISPQNYVHDLIDIPKFDPKKSTVTKTTSFPIQKLKLTRTLVPLSAKPPTTRLRRYVQHQDSNETAKNEPIPNPTPEKDNQEKFSTELPERSLLFEPIEPFNDESGIQVNESYKTEIFTPQILNIETAKPNVSELFNNIRLTLWFDYKNIDFKNESIEFDRLVEGLSLAVDKIEKLFKVIPVSGPLRLRRQNACHRYWHTLSPNGGKCGVLKPDYNGEKCLDDFTFPDEHLDGFSLYNAHDPEPVEVIHKNGSGITGSDIVVYVRSTDTLNCRKNKGVIAYASSCQMDQNDRPVAGYANFCPAHLSKQHTFDAQKFYLTALHEFFHILGFSKSHYDNFRDCKMDLVQQEDHHEEYMHRKVSYKWGWICDRRKQVVNYMQNMYRIMTPAIMRQTNSHFNCSDMGAPLDSGYALPVKSSHWESRFFQGSLMTSNIGVAHLTSLDIVTLAAFEDMGWYKVDYSEAQPLPWGTQAGCEFGSITFCRTKQSPFFCSPVKDIRYGCHYLHLDKGECTTDDYLDSCAIYKASETSRCWDERIKGNNTDATGESYSIDSRCFVASLNKVDLSQAEGRCYKHRCNDSGTLEVMIGNMGWQLCEDGAEIIVPGYQGVLYCPSPAKLCSTAMKNLVVPTQITPVIEDNAPFCATVQMTFPSLNTVQNKHPSMLQNFLMKFANQIVAVTDIHDSTVIEFLLMKNLDWSTLEPIAPITSKPTMNYPNPDSEKSKEKPFDSYHASIIRVPCNEAIKRLLNSVNRGIFEVSISGEVFIAKTMNITSKYDAINELVVAMTINEVKQIKINTISLGTTAAVIIGSLCGTMLIGVGVALYYKSHVPRAVTPAPPSPGVDARYFPPPRNVSALSTSSTTSDIQSVSHFTFNV